MKVILGNYQKKENMSDKKLTAVQWLKEQIECFGNKHELQMSWATLDELLEQAKQMEKEQIVDAYYYDPNCDEIKDDGELYYKETYGGHSVDANEMIDHIADVSKMVGGQDEK
jgi:hypothetical protein